MASAGLITEDIKPHFSSHTLRHTAVSLWIEMGLQPACVQKLLGHASLRMMV
ncbi:tyrosine-type recombinase/integrase [Azospirillum rugosum]|uniref:Integrase n=1 Tax=Azospirillum rugosum TaxID=416170 RepID=A0ABS4SNS7_9PROT|nr:integrase [Azospirillum rugosum]MDQ0527400.1 integrase [Azospirillum rugosum]